MTIREFCKTYGIHVTGSLDLEDTGITALPDGLTVGGYLDLRGTGITALPDGLTVGGGLYLEGTGITALPDGLTVGGGLDLRGTGITDTSNIKRLADDHVFFWLNKKYVKADGIFSEIVSHRDNVYRIRQIGRNKIGYLVTDGNGKWAHGNTLDEARKDLVYKVKDRDTSRYKGMTLDTVLSHEAAIEAYRVITGACSLGTRHFVEGAGAKLVKTEYTIREIIEFTKGQYNHTAFANFFGKGVEE